MDVICSEWPQSDSLFNGQFLQKLLESKTSLWIYQFEETKKKRERYSDFSHHWKCVSVINHAPFKSRFIGVVCVSSLTFLPEDLNEPQPFIMLLITSALFLHRCKQHQLRTASWSRVIHTIGAKVFTVAQDLFIFDFCCMGHTILSEGNKSVYKNFLRPLLTNSNVSTFIT